MTTPDRRKFSLVDLIADMLRKADRDIMVTQKRRLPNGLTIKITNEKICYRLELSRSFTVPATTEWTTVLKYWPYFVTAQANLDVENHKLFQTIQFNKQEILKY